MDAASSRFVASTLARFYASRSPSPPPEMARREFAFTYFGREGMHRPVVFGDARALGAHLAAATPSHAYYSTALYDNPEAPMALKRWRGADLLFDLDADHLPGAKGLDYAEMLRRVKVEFRRLLSEFLLGDLGFDPARMLITFSGGRGYHCHYRDPRIQALRNPERREIVDFVLARGLGLSVVRADSSHEPWHMDPDAGGWRGRIARGALHEVARLAAMPRQDAVASIETALRRVETERDTPVAMPERDAKRLWTALFGARRGGCTADRLLARRSMLVWPEGSASYRLALLLAALTIARQRTEGLNLGSEADHRPGETDATVTGDEKRIIRLPGSVHGKTGLVVTPIEGEDPVAALDAFDPLRDAVMPCGGRTARVAGKRDASIRMAGEDAAVRAGEVAELPESAALFFVLRGDAEAAA